MLGLLAAGAPSALAQVEESSLKAAFVYNIVAFSSWDGGRAADALVICSGANPPLNAAIADLTGRTVGQRRIAVRPASPDARCDVLVHAGDTVAPGGAPAVLVICDGCSLPNGVTAVALVREGSRVRFDVDPAPAAKAGIGFSSQLLRLARRVL